MKSVSFPFFAASFTCRFHIIIIACYRLIIAGDPDLGQHSLAWPILHRAVESQDMLNLRAVKGSFRQIPFDKWHGHIPLAARGQHQHLRYHTFSGLQAVEGKKCMILGADINIAANVSDVLKYSETVVALCYRNIDQVRSEKLPNLICGQQRQYRMRKTKD